MGKSSDSEDVIFENDRGDRLVGTLRRPGGPSEGGVVICHGMLSHRRSLKHRALARELVGRGLVTLRFDFYGRGDSDGRTEEITYEGQLRDVAAAVPIVRREVDRVALVGSSMGGAVAILHAARDKEIACVATIATVGRPGSVIDGLGGPDLEERWKREGTIEIVGHKLGWDLLVSARRTDVVEAARSLDCPLLLIHGALDEVVPIVQAEELSSAARDSRLVVLPHGDHRLHGTSEQEELVRLVGEFMGEKIAGRGGPISPPLL